MSAREEILSNIRRSLRVNGASLNPLDSYDERPGAVLGE